MLQHGAGAEPEWCGRARELSYVSETEAEVTEEGSQRSRRSRGSRRGYETHSSLLLWLETTGKEEQRQRACLRDLATQGDLHTLPAGRAVQTCCCMSRSRYRIEFLENEQKYQESRSLGSGSFSTARPSSHP